VARLLIVDDSDDNRIVLSRPLQRQGHEVDEAVNGVEALAALERADYDLVLLDIMMPEMDGYEVLERMRTDVRMRTVPVVVISAIDDMESIVRCVELGADDYLTKPFDRVLLRARVNACLEKKRLRDEESRNLKRIAQQLSDASEYVRSLLPEPVDGAVRIEWSYVPSAELGGDTFGYHWLDSDRLALYLLDVCGHGVGPALLSVSVMNVLRSGTLQNADPAQPSSVLSALNRAFPRERHQNKHFTLWYGVYDTVQRTLTYASGGHPPAILMEPNNPEFKKLQTPGLILGLLANARFTDAVCDVPPGARLFVYSDGVYEIEGADGEILEHEDFLKVLREECNATQDSPLKAICMRLTQLTHGGIFTDDFSLIQVTF
jgi:sigma-B regulation protein RsbU (phosphoserine phosphatase)